MTDFYSNYVELCKKDGKSLSSVAEEIGLTRTSAHRWKHGAMPTDITIAKLAEYFGVAVERLITRENTDSYHTEFYRHFLDLCLKRSKSPSKVAYEIGLSKATVGRWKKGAIPRDVTVQRIADYFNVSVTDLMGATREEVLTSDLDTLDPVDPIDEELFKLIQQLSPAKKALLLEKAKMIEKI